MAEPDADLLDHQRLASLVEEIGDADLVRQAVQAFLDEVPDRLAAIRVALVGGDPQELRSAAHALGSPAAMLGALAVSRVSKALQAAALEESTEECRALVDDIVEVTHRTEVEMRAYVAGSASA
jgi:HPt (histidine-containing phosphotransfer) domain-containing protein